MIDVTLQNDTPSADLDNDNHLDAMNGVVYHGHIPAIANTGGGKVACGICGEVLMSPDS